MRILVHGLLVSVLCLAVSTTIAAEPDAAAPAKPGLFGKFGDAVRKGVTDGVNNGVQSTGRVTVLGYTMAYSKLQRREIPAYCLANADTGKLITVSPMFGTPFQRDDGTAGFTQMAEPVDRNHDRIEVNLQGVLPGLNCADLIAQRKLSAYPGSSRGADAAAGPPAAASTDTPQVMGCLTKPVAKVETDQVDAAIRKGLIPQGAYWVCVSRRSAQPESLLNIAEHKLYPLPAGFTSAEGRRADGSTVLPANVQAGWDNVDRIQREGAARIQAQGADQQSANADRALLRKAAFEKCKPLIKGDNAKMEAFKACVAKATE